MNEHSQTAKKKFEIRENAQPNLILEERRDSFHRLVWNEKYSGIAYNLLLLGSRAITRKRSFSTREYEGIEWNRKNVYTKIF